MVSWIVFRAEVFKSKRSNRRCLRDVLTRFRPVEMGRIARQNDDASGRICLQLFRIETGLEEINCDLLEADFWPGSLRVCPGHNFRLASQPETIAITSHKPT